VRTLMRHTKQFIRDVGLVCQSYAVNSNWMANGKTKDVNILILTQCAQMLIFSTPRNLKYISTSHTIWMELLKHAQVYTNSFLQCIQLLTILSCHLCM